MSRKPIQEFNDSLTRITQFLCEDKDKADYVIMCFNKQLQYDIQEMEQTEGNMALVERYETMMETRNMQVNIIKNELKNFKNDKFKTRVAELLQWMCLQIDFPDSYENHYSKDLKTYLSAMRRYQKDMVKVSQDVNTTFKSLSLKPDLPAN